MLTKKFFKSILLIVMLCFFAAIAACGSKAELVKDKFESSVTGETKVTDQPQTEYEEKDVASGVQNENAGKADKASTPQTNPGAETEKIPTKIIKTADISYQVEKFDASRRSILGIVNRFRAYVSSEDQTRDDYRLSNTMVVRVDAPVFDTLVDALMKEAIYVEYKKISASDVTEEYVDVTARLKSKKEVEAQYEEILKKAKSIDEILDVQQYLRTIREEIESFEGRLKYMNDRVAYSTITLRFYETLDVVSKQPDRNFGSKVEEAFSWGWNGLVTFFLALIYMWPVWLILGITAILLVYFLKRGRRKRRKVLDSAEVKKT